MRAALRVDVRLKVAEKERDQWEGKYEATEKVSHRQGRARRARFADGGALGVAMPPISICGFYLFRRCLCAIEGILFRVDALLVVGPAARTRARFVQSRTFLPFRPTIFVGWVKHRCALALNLGGCTLLLRTKRSLPAHAHPLSLQARHTASCSSADRSGSLFGRPPPGPRMTPLWNLDQDATPERGVSLTPEQQRSSLLSPACGAALLPILPFYQLFYTFPSVIASWISERFSFIVPGSMSCRALQLSTLVRVVYSYPCAPCEVRSGRSPWFEILGAALINKCSRMKGDPNGRANKNSLDNIKPHGSNPSRTGVSHNLENNLMEQGRGPTANEPRLS
ncbi:hypothetical protein B0H13DRAFT_1927496 [Mycena leptocephala]|nr:hypothetical protein B0H13DRAFT_1927496 [Mycena leptocephala]